MQRRQRDEGVVSVLQASPIACVLHVEEERVLDLVGLPQHIVAKFFQAQLEAAAPTLQACGSELVLREPLLLCHGVGAVRQHFSERLPGRFGVEAKPFVGQEQALAGCHLSAS